MSHQLPMQLSVVGCGHLGRTLSHLWHQHNTFKIHQVINPSLSSARQAVDFIEAGQALCLEDKPAPSTFWLIATPDYALPEAVAWLQKNNALRSDSIIFHCSGALSSSELIALKTQEQSIASVHPVHSFADPSRSIHQFSGTVCACEGDETALKPLMNAFKAIGGHTLAIETSKKMLYHTGTVMACNYLVTLLDRAMSLLTASGLDRQAIELLLPPIVHATAQNCFEKGPEQALTGPIARGEADIVRNQLKLLQQQSEDDAELYQLLGKLTLSLAKRTNRLEQDQVTGIQQALENNSTKDS